MGRVTGGDVNDTAEEDGLVSGPADKGRCLGGGRQ